MFEEWQIFLLAMEIFRFYEADLVVAMVDSIVLEVYELMKFYEKDGLLKIAPAFRMNSPVSLIGGPSIFSPISTIFLMWKFFL